MEQNQIQGFRVNIQVNSNLFPDDFRTPSGNEIASFVSSYSIVIFVSFQTFRFIRVYADGGAQIFSIMSSFGYSFTLPNFFSTLKMENFCEEVSKIEIF